MVKSSSPPPIETQKLPTQWSLTEGVDYVIDYGNKLGSGSFGSVYRGVLLITMQRVAVKVLSFSDTTSADEALYGVTAELRMAMLLSGSSASGTDRDVFVRCFGGSVLPVERNQKAGYVARAHMVMEQMRCTFKDFLREVEARFSASQRAVPGVPAVVRAMVILEELGRHRITHGDVKLNNIMVVGELPLGESDDAKLLDHVSVKLSDFGLTSVYGNEQGYMKGRTVLSGLLAPHRFQTWKWRSSHPTYHPLRLTVWAGPSVDQFAILVILVRVVFAFGRDMHKHFVENGGSIPRPEPQRLEKAQPGTTEEMYPWKCFRALAHRVLNRTDEVAVNTAYLRYLLGEMKTLAPRSLVDVIYM